MDVKKAEIQIRAQFQLMGTLTFLGQGCEGYVWTDGNRVYKVIINSKQKLELYWTLLSLSESIAAEDNMHVLPKFTPSFAHNFVFITYPFEKTRAFLHGDIVPIDEFVALMRQFKKVRWVCWDLQPKNFRVTASGTILMIDIGRGFLPVSNYLFESMCRRAFVIYKLQGFALGEADFRTYLTAVNQTADFAKMRDFGLSAAALATEFCAFYQQIIRRD